MIRFNKWLVLKEANARLSKKLIGKGIEPDGSLVVDGGSTSPLTNIQAANQPDEEIPGNKLYMAMTASGSTYTVSMDDQTAKAVLSTFFAMKSQQDQNKMFAKYRNAPSARRSARIDLP